MVFLVQTEFKLHREDDAVGESQRVGEGEHGGMILTELRVHGPARVRLIVESAGDRKVGLVLLEVGDGFGQTHLLGGSARDGRGENPDAA